MNIFIKIPTTTINLTFCLTLSSDVTVTHFFPGLTRAIKGLHCIGAAVDATTNYECNGLERWGTLRGVQRAEEGVAK